MLSTKSWIRIVALGASLSLVGLLLGNDLGGWLVAVGTMLLPGAILGAAVPPSRRGRAGLLPEALVLCLVLGVTIWHWFPVGPRLFGWPLATVFMALALGVVPFLLTVWGAIARFGEDDEEGEPLP